MDVRLETAVSLTKPWATETAEPAPYRLDVSLERENLLPVISALFAAEWGYLSAITGVDLGTAVGVVEVLYHFCEGPCIVTLRLRVPYDDAQIDSVCSIIPSASFFERELSEMLGITIVGTPNADRLFLPDDWPLGVYPLRKEYVMQG
ncbi:MAG: NADH-quinone oxidoreductase subunit C [Chloroflexota bacterium]|nr:NADH-quinone oxidoreductase subunit C [Ardenticatenaceae bacterium]